MDEMTEALSCYLRAWESWKQKSAIPNIEAAPAMHFGWKVANETELLEKLKLLLPHAPQANISTVDERKIALLVLEPRLVGIPIAQLMQRRPGSKDRLGLDHVAFWCKNTGQLGNSLAETDINWENQHNEGHAWISLWFGNERYEAKFFDHTSLDIGAKSLYVSSEKLKTGWDKS